MITPTETNKNYQWPASALTTTEMGILADMRKRTGVPITQLLKRCVSQFKNTEV